MKSFPYDIYNGKKSSPEQDIMLQHAGEVEQADQLYIYTFYL